MTTEAEEFKKQERRFENLIILFCDIWSVNIRSVKYVWGPFRGNRFRVKLAINNEVILITRPYYYRYKSKALRALNDRLELALQGKVKDDQS